VFCATARTVQLEVEGSVKFTSIPDSPEDLKMARKRELIEPNEGDKRYVRRDENGRFTSDQVDVGRSLAADRRQHAKTKAKPGQGDKGDH
jgi:hypothetical protein